MIHNLNIKNVIIQKWNKYLTASIINIAHLLDYNDKKKT